MRVAVVVVDDAQAVRTDGPKAVRSRYPCCLFLKEPTFISHLCKPGALYDHMLNALLSNTGKYVGHRRGWKHDNGK